MFYEIFNHFMEKISLVKEIIVMVVAVAGVVIAGLGLKTWNAQLKGTTRYKIAKDVLTKTFKLRDEFDRARAPLMTAAEMSHVGSGKEETNDELSFKAHVKRLNKLNDVKQELEIVKLEADAVFNEEETVALQELIDKVHEMNRSFNFMHEMKEIDNLSKEEGEMLKESRWILYGTKSERDSFGKSVTDLVNDVEEKFRKYLK